MKKYCIRALLCFVVVPLDIPWISIYIHYIVGDEIIQPYQNSISATTDV